MLRVGQYSSISRRLLAIRSSPAFVQKDALVLSGQLPRTLASHDNNVCCCHTLASNSNSSVSNATRGLAIVSTYTMPGNPYGASSRRLMSTTPEGASGGKDVSGASQAGHGAAPSTSFVPDGAAGLNADAAAATDAITASAGAADQVRTGGSINGMRYPCLSIYLSIYRNAVLNLRPELRTYIMHGRLCSCNRLSNPVLGACHTRHIQRRSFRLLRSYSTILKLYKGYCGRR